MRFDLMSLPAVGLLLLGGVLEAAGRAELAEPVDSTTSALSLVTPEAEMNQAAPYIWASGYHGVQYYSNPGVQAAVVNAAPAPRTARTNATRPRTVGPGVRDWTTGQRLGSHKPWLRSRG